MLRGFPFSNHVSTLVLFYEILLINRYLYCKRPTFVDLIYQPLPYLYQSRNKTPLEIRQRPPLGSPTHIINPAKLAILFYFWNTEYYIEELLSPPEEKKLPPPEEKLLRTPTFLEKYSKLPWLILPLVLILILIAAFIITNKTPKSFPAQQPVPPTQTLPTSQPTPTPYPTVNWKTYTNTKLSYSFRYPAEWFLYPPQKTTSLDLQTVSPASYTTRDTDGVPAGDYVDVFVDDNSKNQSVEEWAKEQLQIPIKLTTQRINGIIWYRTTDYPFYIGGEAAFTIQGGKVFNVAWTKTGKNSDISTNTFQEILSTFKFTDQNQAVISPSTAISTLWDINCGGCDKFLTFLVTDPYGNQTGYIPSTKSYMKNIPNTNYGIQGGIAPPDGSAPAMPNIVEFTALTEGTKHGIYTIQVNGFANGNYDLQIGIIASANDHGNPFDITGSVTQNSVDTYKITIPSGVYTKVSP